MAAHNHQLPWTRASLKGKTTCLVWNIFFVDQQYTTAWNRSLWMETKSDLPFFFFQNSCFLNSVMFFCLAETCPFVSSWNSVGYNYLKELSRRNPMKPMQMIYVWIPLKMRSSNMYLNGAIRAKVDC